MRGIFITFEGPEGGGKSLQVEKIREYLKQEGYDVLVVREPGQTEIGEEIRQVLLNPKNKKMDSRTEILLFEASRAQLVKEMINPALATGKIVLADRFYDSTTAYQGYGRGMNLNDIKWLNQFATGGLIPDLTILLDVPPEVGIARRKKSKKKDRLDMEGIEFHQRVRKGYLKMAEKEPKRWRIVDANRPIEEIFEEIKKIVEEKIVLMRHK